jgi:hypothetical protein
MVPPLYGAAAGDENPPADLVPLRLIRNQLAGEWVSAPQTWREVIAEPEDYLFGLWALDAVELWGRRGRHDAKLVLIAAPLPERQRSAYDTEELQLYSCLRRRHGEAYYDLHVRANPPSIMVLPLGAYGDRPRTMPHERSQGRGGRPSRGDAIRAAYMQLPSSERRRRGIPLYRRIWRALHPDRKDTDPPPPGLSADTIDRALRGVKDKD